ncbi:hypothetical protein DVA67_027790 [Solirubrobacter sp. CPCC 204708]|nr:hypothetical protein [Solirubrobacter deserti]
MSGRLRAIFLRRGTALIFRLPASGESFQLVEVRANRREGGHGVRARRRLPRTFYLSRDHLTEPNACGRGPAQLLERLPGHVVDRNSRYTSTNGTLLP